jgi:hypothetical protein
VAADPGNTALALTSLALVRPYSNPIISEALDFLLDSIQNADYEDFTEELRLNKIGMGPSSQQICIPTAPRMVQALLACRISPRDQSISDLFNLIRSRSRPEERRANHSPEAHGWGLKTDSNSSWYTSIVVYACSDYLHSAEPAYKRPETLDRMNQLARMESMSLALEQGQSRIRELDRALTVSLDESVALRNERAAWKPRSMNAYRLTSYCSAAGGLVALLFASAMIYLYGSTVDSTLMKWAGGVLSASSVVSVAIVIFRYFSRAIPAPPFTDAMPNGGQEVGRVDH